jgi:hypothetical protein
MSIELTPQTLDVLKNFSTINSNLLITPGSVLRTISQTKNVIGRATVAENFTSEFGIYDLSNFIGVLSSFENPVLTFSEETEADGTAKYVVISDRDGSGSFKYYGSPKNVLKFLTKDITMPEPALQFDLPKDVLTKCLKAATMSSLPNMVVQSEGEKLDLVVRNEEVDSSNEFRITLSDEGNGNKLNIIFDVLNLRLIPGTYRVAMDGKMICQFVNDEKSLQYYIASERNSDYGEVVAENG